MFLWKGNNIQSQLLKELLHGYQMWTPKFKKGKMRGKSVMWSPLHNRSVIEAKYCKWYAMYQIFSLNCLVATIIHICHLILKKMWEMRMDGKGNSTNMLWPVEDMLQQFLVAVIMKLLCERLNSYVRPNHGDFKIRYSKKITQKGQHNAHKWPKT